MKKYFKYVICILLIIIDQLSKYIVSVNFDLYETKVIIKNFFNITYNINDGAAFGILSGARIFFILITVFIMFYLIKNLKEFIENNGKFTIFSVTIIISGIIGNLIDRICFGYVRDFLDFRIFTYKYPIFNFADSFIVIGVILLIISEVKNGKNSNKWK